MANAARTANRVVAVTKGEAENTLDVEYKSKLDTSQAGVSTGEWVWSSSQTDVMSIVHVVILGFCVCVPRPSLTSSGAHGCGC